MRCMKAAATLRAACSNILRGWALQTVARSTRPLFCEVGCLCRPRSLTGTTEIAALIVIIGFLDWMGEHR